MSATSVTGLSGKGIAYGARGPGNKRNQFVPNVCPHVVASGKIDATIGGAATVVFSDPLVGDKTDYIVLLMGQDDATGSVIITKNATSNKMTGFTVASATASVGLGWVVVNLGQGIDTVSGIEVVS